MRGGPGLGALALDAVLGLAAGAAVGAGLVVVFL